MSSIVDELFSVCWSKVTEGSYFRDLIFADLITRFITELENALDLTTQLLSANETELLNMTVSKTPNKRISKEELTGFLRQLVGEDLNSWLLKRSNLSSFQLRRLMDKRSKKPSRSTLENPPNKSGNRYLPNTPPVSPKPVQESFKKFKSYDGTHKSSYTTGLTFKSDVDSISSWELRRKEATIEKLKITCSKYKRALEQLTAQNEEANIQLKSHLEKVTRQNELIRSLSMKLKLNDSIYDDATATIATDLFLYKLPTLKQIRALRLLSNDRWSYRWYIFCILVVLSSCILLANVIYSGMLLLLFIVRLSLQLLSNDNWNEVATFQWWKAFSTLEASAYAVEDWIHYNS